MALGSLGSVDPSLGFYGRRDTPPRTLVHQSQLLTTLASTVIVYRVTAINSRVTCHQNGGELGEEERLQDPGPDGAPLVDAELIARLALHHWPGNVRELRNVVRRSAVANRVTRSKPGVPPESGGMSTGSNDFVMISRSGTLIASATCKREAVLELVLRAWCGNQRGIVMLSSGPKW